MKDQPPGESHLLEEIVDHVMAILPPYETSVYLYLLRNSRLMGEPTVRVGKRTIGEGIGKGTRSKGGSYQHITNKLKALEQEGFIQTGETNRTGTVYAVALPGEVPAIRERMAVAEPSAPVDHYRNPALRTELFERDGWSCRYCGDNVTPETATLDHIQPVSSGGQDDPENLATACMMCNSIKSGRTYEEAAPQLLSAITARRTKSMAISETS